MFAQVAPDPENVAAFFSAIVSAVGSKNYGLLIALAVIAIVYAARKFGSKYIPFLGTDRGGVLLSLVSGLGLSVYTAAVAAGEHTVGEVLVNALLASITASGTYALLKKLIWPTGKDMAQELVAVEPKVEEVKVEEALKTDASATDLLNTVVK